MAGYPARLLVKPHVMLSALNPAVIAVAPWIMTKLKSRPVISNVALFQFSLQ